MVCHILGVQSDTHMLKSINVLVSGRVIMIYNSCVPSIIVCLVCSMCVCVIVLIV